MDTGQEIVALDVGQDRERSSKAAGLWNVHIFEYLYKDNCFHMLFPGVNEL